MSTELTTPVDVVKTYGRQDIINIIMDLANGDIIYTIVDFEEGTDVPLRSNTYVEQFADIPAGPVKENFKGVLNDIRNLARSKGQLGEGVDTDPI